MPWILRVCNTSLMKTLGKGELHEISICRNIKGKLSSPFTTEVSTGFESFLRFSSNLKLLPANSFSLGWSKICRWEWVNTSADNRDSVTLTGQCRSRSD